MFNEDHCRSEAQDQPLDLHPRINIDIIEGFVPDVQVSPFAEAFRDQDFLFLSERIRRDIGFILSPAEIQLAQQRVEQDSVETMLYRELIQRSG